VRMSAAAVRTGLDSLQPTPVGPTGPPRAARLAGIGRWRRAPQRGGGEGRGVSN